MKLTASAMEFDGTYQVQITCGALTASAKGKGFWRTLCRAWVGIQLERLLGPGEGGYAA